MATVTFTIPNAFATRINDAIATKYNYNPATDGTKADFAKSIVIRYLKGVVMEVEGQLAARAAGATVEADVDAVNIT